MKFLTSLFSISILMACTTLAADVKELPKFENALPQELFFNKSPLPVGHTYGFATNKSLDELKPEILKFLGEGWTMEVVPEDELKAMNPPDDIKIIGVARLVHKDFEGYDIGVTLTPIPEKADDKFKKHTRILSIITVDKQIAKEIREGKKK